jgi:putative transposase
VSNDNPFSEATFKTIKYSAGFPDRFANIVVARTFCSEFFTWYNREHRHTGLALFTPEMVHYNQIEKVALERQNVLDAAFSANPARFSRQPIVQLPQTEVFINPPLRDIIA